MSNFYLTEKDFNVMRKIEFQVFITLDRWVSKMRGYELGNPRMRVKLRPPHSDWFWTHLASY
jgi:hypothetical protein